MFKFQQIGRKEIAIIGDILVCHPVYEWLTDSKGNKHYVRIEETEERLYFDVDDLTESEVYDDLNFIGEPFSDWIVRYPDIEVRWIAERIHSRTNSVYLHRHVYDYISSLATEWKDKGISLDLSSNRSHLIRREFTDDDNCLLFFGLPECGLKLRVDLFLFIENLWSNLSLRKYMIKNCVYPEISDILTCSTQHNALTRLFSLKNRLYQYQL